MIAKTHGLNFSSKTLPKPVNPETSFSWTKTITLTSSKWKETGIGYGTSENVAMELAAMVVLKKLINHCDNDSDTAVTIRNILNLPYQGLGDEGEDGKDTGSRVTPPPPPPPPIVFPDFTESENILYVYKGKRACEKNKHEIISVKGIFTSFDKDGKQIKINFNINYCKTCKEFFIGLESFKSKQEEYGILLGNISFENLTPFIGKGGVKNLASESPLFLCGYTVNAEDNLSIEQRRFILRYVLDHDVLEKYQVIKYLEFFIDLHEDKKNMKAAVGKWKDDLRWVNNYKIDKQMQVKISKIKKKH